MPVTIDDERCENALRDSITRGDGPGVARLVHDLIMADRDTLVRRACMSCTHSCHPKHFNELARFFGSAHKRKPRDRSVLADVIATIMYGVRHKCDAPDPGGTCRAALDALMLDMSKSPPRPGCVTPDDLSRLPAKLGRAWSGLVALARVAVRAHVVQEGLVHNQKLGSLVGGERCSDEDALNTGDLKMCVLWTYSRDGAPPPPARREIATDSEPVRPVVCESLVPPSVPSRVNCQLTET